ncbi:MAG: hypothetical protein AB7O38_11220 [Pirellulaceae bacterium]
MPLILDPVVPPPRSVPWRVSLCVWLNPLLLVGAILCSTGTHTAAKVVRHWRVTGKLADRLPVSRSRHVPGSAVSTSLFTVSRFRESANMSPPRFAAITPRPKLQPAQRGRRKVSVGIESRQAGDSFSKALIGLVMPAVGLILFGKGAYAAYWEHRHLKSSHLGLARIVRCQTRRMTSAWNWQLGGIRIETGRESAGNWTTLENLRSSVLQERATALACWNRWNRAASRTMAIVLGAMLGALVAMVIHFCFQSLASIPMFLGLGGTAGGLLGLGLERRYGFLECLDKPGTCADQESLPEFKGLVCQLEFARDGKPPFSSVVKKLDLCGDERDVAPRPLLFPSATPARALLLEQTTLRLSQQDTRWIVGESWLPLRLGGFWIALVVLSAHLWWPLAA